MRAYNGESAFIRVVSKGILEEVIIELRCERRVGIHWVKEARRAFQVDQMQRPCGGQQYNKCEGLKQGQCIWSEGSEAEYGGR